MKIKVLIADDHQLFREGLAKLLGSDPEIEIIALAEDGEEAIEFVEKYNPDMILLDIAMPKMNGIEATRKLKTDYPDIKIIAVSMHKDKQYVKGALEAGADGYLVKNTRYQQLIDAIKMVYSGKKFLCEDIAEMIIKGYLNLDGDELDSYDNLSEREKEIFKLFAEGKSTREISEKLFISVKTVGTHKQNIFDKLELKTSTDLIKYAVKKGLILLD